MANENSVPGDLAIADLPATQQSSIRRWYESAKGGLAVTEKAKQQARAGGAALRQGGEALLVGGILGAADNELKNGLDIQGKIPVDAIVGVAGLVAGTLTAPNEYAVDLRNAGAAGVAIFGYRKTRQLLAEKKRKAGQKPGFENTVAAHGDTADFGAEDPIVAAARLL